MRLYTAHTGLSIYSFVGLLRLAPLEERDELLNLLDLVRRLVAEVLHIGHVAFVRVSMAVWILALEPVHDLWLGERDQILLLLLQLLVQLRDGVLRRFHELVVPSSKTVPLRLLPRQPFLPVFFYQVLELFLGRLALCLHLLELLLRSLGLGQ